SPLSIGTPGKAASLSCRRGHVRSPRESLSELRRHRQSGRKFPTVQFLSLQVDHRLPLELSVPCRRVRFENSRSRFHGTGWRSGCALASGIEQSTQGGEWIRLL